MAYPSAADAVLDVRGSELFGMPSVSDRFVEAFGLEAAYRWKLRHRPMTTSLFDAAMKKHFIGPIREQLVRGRVFSFPLHKAGGS